jgi:hypothetical protein
VKPSLLFLPDISGFTEFVNSTEVSHSQHVISELLEVLLDANTLNLQLAEIEGDALFFYKEEEVPSMEMLLAQVEHMFTAFHSHLKLMETNRICPCNACAMAPNLELKIIAHAGELQFINVQNNRKPFGGEVIEAHRLMKNSVNSDNYVLISKSLSDQIEMRPNYMSMLYKFDQGEDKYDGKTVEYIYSIIDKNDLKLKPFNQAKKVEFKEDPLLQFEYKVPIAASELLEYITNYRYRHHWVDGVDSFEFNEHEVTRVGSEHVCVINDKHIDFITVTKAGKPGQFVYGELSTDGNPLGQVYQFYIITPIDQNSCMLEVEIYLDDNSSVKRFIKQLLIKNVLWKNLKGSLDKLMEFVSSQPQSEDFK